MTRTLVALAAALAVTGCATSRPAGTPTSFQPVCQPCAMPCTPETSCAPPKVAEAPKPPPPPAPPPPAPKQPAAAPNFTPAPGTFQEPQQVTLSSATPGAVIRYTTDGTTPTDSSPVYSGPIRVDGTTSINAVAMSSDTEPSPIASGTYTIQPPPPPPPPSRVTVGKEKLELTEKVFFDTGKASIKKDSYGLLDDVASTLKGHPEVKKVVIEGYTDDVGAAKANKALSQKRAAAVKTYLVKKGVEPARLDAKGFGEEKPIESNKTPKGREANRRVEFRLAQ